MPAEYVLPCALALGLLAVLNSPSVEAAPTHPFPAVRRTSGAAPWPVDTPSVSLPTSGASQAALMLGWDQDHLFVRVIGAPASSRLVLDFAGIDPAIEDTPGGLRVIASATGHPLADAEVRIPSDAWDVRIPWKSLGHDAVKSGQAFPCNIRWRAGTGRTVELPGGSLGFNPLTWGVFFLNDGIPFDLCAPTLTKPFLFRFDQGAATGKPYLSVEPEPLAGLCLPAEIQFLATRGMEETVLRSRRTAGGHARFDIPVEPGAASVGASIRPSLYASTDPVSYFALQPGRKLQDFQGHADWKIPEDFDAYWNRAKADLAKVPMNPRITEVKEKASATGRLYRVELDSVDNVTFVCWYFVPKGVDVLGGSASQRFPAVQIMPGYGAEEPPLDRTDRGYVTLSVNPRGHGPSGQFWPFPPGGHHMWNITDPETYYYRAAYMDCVRAIDFLSSRPEVDPQRIGVEGSSQGGAFALATASLDHRVAASAPNIPFLCDLPTSVFFGSRGSMSGLRKFFVGDSEENLAVRRTLAYIDGRHMATRIRCPIVISVGEMDRSCPPVGGVAAFHALPNDTLKELLIIPGRDHEVPPEYRAKSEALFTRWLKESK